MGTPETNLRRRVMIKGEKNVIQPFSKEQATMKRPHQNTASPK
jgi:hypothetical protein